MNKEELFERELAKELEEDTDMNSTMSSMSSKCTPCLGSRIKEILVSSIDSPELHEKIKSIPDCADYLDISLCDGRRGRGKSPYQQFISTCMKSQNIHGFGAAAPAMKKCAQEWSKQKLKI